MLIKTASADAKEAARQQVTRRELRQYACGCSTTRIESYWLPGAEAAACAAHQGELLHCVVEQEYGPRRKAAPPSPGPLGA